MNTVFIDESSNQGAAESPFVIAAVAIPAGTQALVKEILPRSNGGTYLKYSDLAITDQMISKFISSLFALRITAVIVGYDVADAENKTIAHSLTGHANIRRPRKKRLAVPNMMYARTVSEALVHIWQLPPESSKEMGEFDVVLDEISLPDQEKNLLTDTVRTQFSKRNTLIGAFAWKHESIEPLLYVPDLLAGVAARKGVSNAVDASWAELMKAKVAGQLMLINGFAVYAG